MKTGIIQHKITADRDLNRSRLAQAIKKVAAEGTELVILQELHDSLYFCQVENVDNHDPLAVSEASERKRVLLYIGL